jgi:hypothetical protein
MGRNHLMITVLGKNARVLFTAGNKESIAADNITQESDGDMSRFLLSTDAIPWIENDKMNAQLLIFGDGINLVFDVLS